MNVFPVSFVPSSVLYPGTDMEPSARKNGNLTGDEWRGNLLLASLPAQDFARIASSVEVVELEQHDILFEQESPITHVYFPTSAVVSFISLMGEKNGVEVGTVGREGFAGLPVFLSDDTSPVRAVIQIPGKAVRMRTTVFQKFAHVEGALHTMLLRYTQAFITQVAQTAVCNTRHLLDSRCARWLLMTHDRVGGDQFPLTHEFLEAMLGVGRPGVTIAMRDLQQENLIHYSRGKVSILDRSGLEDRSCLCYGVVSAHFAKLFVGAA